MEGSRSTLETQILTLESATLNLSTLLALKSGSNALQSIHAGMSLQKVDDTLQDIQDQMDIANEVSDAIAAPLSSSQAIDDEDLESELLALEQEDLDQRLLSSGLEALPAPIREASQPRLQKVQYEKSEEDEELEALKRAMAM